MMPADWFAITLSFLGGLVIAIIFYWVSQKNDFKKISSNLEYLTSNLNNEIRVQGQNIDIIKASTVLYEPLKLTESLATINEKIYNLNTNVDRSFSNVMSELKGHQSGIIDAVQNRYESQVNETREVLENAINREISSLINSVDDRAKLSHALLDLIKHAMFAMGYFQSASVQELYEKFLEEVASNMQNAVTEVSHEVQDLSAEFNSSLPISLPTSTRQNTRK